MLFDDKNPWTNLIITHERNCYITITTMRKSENDHNIRLNSNKGVQNI